jgi:hypothetical protein
LLAALLLPPLALYLLVLGWVNRRPRPVLMAGTWEFVGVLFALSGFILLGGPAFLSSLDEQSRWFWLLGEAASGKPSGGSWAATIWVVIRLLYFALIAGGAAFVLWRCRRLTSVYNVDPRAVFTALELTFQRLGLASRRTGDSFQVGGRTAGAAKEDRSETIQTSADAAQTAAAPAPAPHTTLRVDVFPAMRHATLRWRPADSPVRREVERDLPAALAETAPPEQESLLGGCLSVLGVALFVLALVAAGLVVLFRLLPPRH